VSVTYKLGVTAAGMIGHAPSPRPTEGKRPIAAAAAAALEQQRWLLLHSSSRTLYRYLVLVYGLYRYSCTGTGT
jgi:hypothetical protein